MSRRDHYPGDKRVIKYLEDNFRPNWTYFNFASDLTMEFFDPNRFADIVADSGAK